MLASLEKLHLSPSIALTLVIAMFGGGLVNIPIATIRRRSDVSRLRSMGSAACGRKME